MFTVKIMLPDDSGYTTHEAESYAVSRKGPGNPIVTIYHPHRLTMEREAKTTIYIENDQGKTIDTIRPKPAPRR